MYKTISYISAVLVGLIFGYLVRDIGLGLQPNYRWVEIFNKSGCELKAVSVLLPDRVVTINSGQFSSSVYPHSAESDVNIPVLVSMTHKYRIHIEFNECHSRTGEPQEFTTGSSIQVWVGKDDIKYSAR
jgi:hypothetical protein